MLDPQTMFEKRNADNDLLTKQSDKFSFENIKFSTKISFLGNICLKKHMKRLKNLGNRQQHLKPYV